MNEMSRVSTSIYLPILITAFLSASLYAQEDSLVGYYPFNGDAQDLSGEQHHGIIYGATLDKDRFGNSESAFFFDGDDFIDLGVVKDYEFGTGDFSISVWFKAEYLDKRQYQIIRKGPDNPHLGEGRWVLSLDREGRARMVLEDAEQSNAVLVSLGQNSFLDNTWHHMVAVFDRDSALTVYVDNELEIMDRDIVNYQGNITSESGTHSYIGRTHNLNEDNNFIGTIDDIRIYNKVLQPDEIANLYFRSGWDGNIHEIEEDTLVAHYPFNGSAAEESGFTNDGQVEGATLTEDRFGNPNSAYQFDGNDYINISHHPVLNSPAKTIQFWFQKTNDEIRNWGLNDSEGMLWKARDTSLNRAFSFSLSGKDSPFGFYLNMGNGSNGLHHVGTFVQIAPRRWYHVVAVIEPGKTSVYVNGTLVNSRVNEGEVINNTSPITIGRASLESLGSRYFVGKIDDIRFYNYALEPSAIRNLYHEGGWPLTEDTALVISEDLVSYYPFSGNAWDVSYNNGLGNIFGANLTTDRFGEMNQAYEFDGLNDHIILQVPIPYFSQNDFTITFWGQGASPDQHFKGLLTSPNNTPFGIHLDDGDRLRLSAQHNQKTVNLTAENLDTYPGDWYRYAVTFKRGEYLRLYRNGEVVASLNESVPEMLDLNLNAPGIYLATLQKDTLDEDEDYFFPGSIDDIRIFNYALDSAEIWESYQQEKGSVVSNEEPELEIPYQSKLYQNYPNPFNPSTIIKFEIPRTAQVSLTVYDLTGRVVATLTDGPKKAGLHEVIFDASDLASGVYLYELKTPEFSEFKKLTLIK
ncbi:LamG-like jellyroll fold domain-containing protein [Gracilimonas mengyeensis]|uniref:Por secretion system C-terminal sorting domain-containing protein n=1 Tax=Gracilimonas mengyeensis TaxID=1302730 RepID=A0A521F269_9BACT|nr:LamG-like jellyroll fold domain-containing protein [Gracilimonas mengyeensis]SMO90207.1 Por secretion system C-terminal sorting domain-containing protein [Gracilimonas mengyeensis]